jgi:hypothetical protein
MPDPNIVLTVINKNNKYLDITTEDINQRKREYKTLKCLVPMDSINVKYEHTRVHIGNNGKFYFVLDAPFYDTAIEWYDQIIDAL